ncbi:MAG: hypothetical protein ACTHKE_04390 [Sphingomicrobium sp.]
MTDTILAAVITAVIGPLILLYLEKNRRDTNRIRRDAEQAREQVKNSHSTNLREELDERHKETLEHFEKQDRHNEEVLRLLGGLERSDNQQWTVINELRDRPRRPWRT